MWVGGVGNYVLILLHSQILINLCDKLVLRLIEEFLLALRIWIKESILPNDPCLRHMN